MKKQTWDGFYYLHSMPCRTPVLKYIKYLLKFNKIHVKITNQIFQKWNYNYPIKLAKKRTSDGFYYVEIALLN